MKTQHDRLEQYQKILQYTPGGSFVYAAEGRQEFSYVSEHLLMMLGYTEEEFQAKFENQFPLLIEAEQREEVLADIQRQIQKAPYDTCFYRIEKKDGSFMWVHDEGHLITDENGKKWFYVVIVDITEMVNVRNGLVNKNQELQALIDSIPVGLIVYLHRDGVTSVAAVNGYMRAHSQGNYKNVMTMNTEQLQNVVYEKDRAKVHAFFADFYEGRKKQAEITYRALVDSSNTYRWDRCVASAIRQADGAVIIYCTYTDVTDQIQKESDYARIVQEIIYSNPESLCAFHLNLTKNQCTKLHGRSAYISALLNADTADGLLENIVHAIIDPHDAEEFRNNYSRERLLQKYADGEEFFTTSYRRIADGNEEHWIESKFRLLQNPFTQDIEAIAFSIDAERRHTEEKIISIITQSEYDVIGTIRVSDGLMEVYYRSPEKLPLKPPYPDYFEQMMAMVAERMDDIDEQAMFLKALRVDTICDALAQSNVYTYTNTIHVHGHSYRKFATFRYLEEDHQKIMFSLNDVTEAFRKEEAHAAELHRALLAAENANRMKSDFLGNVSHDMRTPLNAILGYDALALEADDVPANVKEYLIKMETAGKTLLALINDTLDLQKIETGEVQMKPEVIKCSEMLQEITASVQPQMDEKNIAFIVDGGGIENEVICMDYLRLREIFVNLLSNAVKFTPNGGKVEFKVVIDSMDDQTIHNHVIVSDNGFGMSQAYLQKLYEPFSQERTEQTEKIEGSGLGLSIVKRCVDLLQGTIEVESEIGKGTTFTIWLDVQRGHCSKIQQEEQEEDIPSIDGMHFLLCEDNEMNAEIACSILQHYGASIDWERDGEAGYRRFEASKEDAYDAVLMDIRMPVMDGYEAAKMIRSSAHAGAKNIPIIAMSADAYSEDVDKALDSGMNAHIAKPIDAAKMVRIISSQVNRSRRRCH